MVGQPPHEINDIAITNSFGMPSREAEFLYADIKKAKDELSEGQVLIVSVVGSACDKKDFVDDYVRATKIAVDAGAPIVEANFSCPNVVTGEGKIYSNPVAVEEIASTLVKSLGDIPLLIKVGVFDDKDQMREMFKAAVRAGVKGIAGINTLSMKVCFNGWECKKRSRRNVVRRAATKRPKPCHFNLQFLREPFALWYRL
jgi:dihydroorotate dehydrogenase (NAD+) catalytic subunit